MVTVTGCGYTLEEKREMKRYEKQGRENAKNYIREKYGESMQRHRDKLWEIQFESGARIFPFSHRKCIRESKYKGADFLVAISGQKKNTDGLDNYQFQEIATAFAQEMYNITGLHAESAYVCYGEYGTVKDEKWNDPHILWWGKSGRSLTEGICKSCVSYANQDIQEQILYRR